MTAEREAEIRELSGKAAAAHPISFERALKESLAEIDAQRERIAEVEGAHAEIWAERNGWQARAEIAEAKLQKQKERIAELEQELRIAKLPTVRHSDAAWARKVDAQQSAIRTLREALEEGLRRSLKPYPEGYEFGPTAWVSLARAALEVTKEFASVDKSLHRE